MSETWCCFQILRIKPDFCQLWNSFCQQISVVLCHSLNVQNIIFICPLYSISFPLESDVSTQSQLKSMCTQFSFCVRVSDLFWVWINSAFWKHYVTVRRKRNGTGIINYHKSNIFAIYRGSDVYQPCDIRNQWVHERTWKLSEDAYHTEQLDRPQCTQDTSAGTTLSQGGAIDEGNDMKRTS